MSVIYQISFALLWAIVVLEAILLEEILRMTVRFKRLHLDFRSKAQQLSLRVYLERTNCSRVPSSEAAAQPSCLYRPRRPTRLCIETYRLQSMECGIGTTANYIWFAADEKMIAAGSLATITWMGSNTGKYL